LLSTARALELKVLSPDVLLMTIAVTGVVLLLLILG